MNLLNNLKSFVYQNCPRFIFRYLTDSVDVIAYLRQYRFSMILNLDDNAISRPILVKGKYEQNVTQVLIQYLKPNIHFLDIGANLGYYSLLVASQCPQSKIYSFEPDKNNFHLFTNSIIYNKFQDRIEPYCLAISDANKKIVISDLGNYANYGARFTSDTEQDLRPHVHGDSPPYYEEIEAVSLDIFLKDITLDIVKIDIEGHEAFAIKGMMELLKRNRPIIFAEFAPSNLSVLGKIEPKKFLQLFTDIDYMINIIDKKGNLLPYHQDIDNLIKDFDNYQTHHIDILLLPIFEKS